MHLEKVVVVQTNSRHGRLEMGKAVDRIGSALPDSGTWSTSDTVERLPSRRNWSYFSTTCETEDKKGVAEIIIWSITNDVE